MKYFYNLIFTVVLVVPGVNLKAQTAYSVKLPVLQQLLSSESDTTYVVNFMATWCKPCMEEIPYFERLQDTLKHTKLKVIYISLDSPADLHKKLIPMLLKRNITTTTYLLDEPNYNQWINTIESSWDGAIPVTIVYNKQKGYRKFISSATTYEHLIENINQIKNP